MKAVFVMPALILALAASASRSALAQSTTTNGLSTTTNSIIGTVNGQSSATSGQTGTSSQSSASTQSGGTICIQEMTATFCNTSSSPNADGYGTIGAGSGSTGSSSSSGSGAGSASAGSGSGGSGATTRRRSLRVADFRPQTNSATDQIKRLVTKGARTAPRAFSFLRCLGPETHARPASSHGPAPCCGVETDRIP